MPSKRKDEPRVLSLSDLQPPTTPIRPFTATEALAAAQKLRRHLDAWHIEDHLGKRYVDDYGAEVAKRERFRDIVLNGEHGQRPGSLTLHPGMLPPNGADPSCNGSAFENPDDEADRQLSLWHLRDFDERLAPLRQVAHWQSLVVAWESVLDAPCHTLRPPYPTGEASWAADHGATRVVVGRQLHPSLGGDLVNAAQLVIATTRVTPPPAPPEGNYRFEYLDGLWRLQFDDEYTEEKDDKDGFRYIALLLQKPHTPLSAARLYSERRQIGKRQSRPKTDEPAGEVEAVSSNAKPDTAIDKRGQKESLARKTQLDKEIAQIKNEMKEAERDSDEPEYDRLHEKCKKLTDEKSQIVNYLLASTGANNKPRALDSGNVNQKAAGTVKKAIAAVRNYFEKPTVGKYKLAAHLKLIEQSGTDFIYRPSNPAPAWRIAT